VCVLGSQPVAKDEGRQSIGTIDPSEEQPPDSVIFRNGRRSLVDHALPWKRSSGCRHDGRTSQANRSIFDHWIGSYEPAAPSIIKVTRALALSESNGPPGSMLQPNSTGPGPMFAGIAYRIARTTLDPAAIWGPIAGQFNR